MAPPLVLDALLDLVGPFLFPILLFALGVAGYGVLVALARLGVVDDGRIDPDPGAREGGDRGPAPDRSSGETDDGNADDARRSGADGDPTGERSAADEGRRL